MARSSLSFRNAMLPQAACASPSPPAPLSTATRVRVADRVARAFPPLACVRGFRYFARKRVDLVSVSERAIESDVRGKRTLRVTLRVDGGRLAVACTSSAKMLGPAACRHVWATLLEIDKRGLFEALRTTQRGLALEVIEAAKAPRPPRAKAPAKAQAAARGEP